MNKTLRLSLQIGLLLMCITVNIAVLYHVVDGTRTYSDNISVTQYEEISSVKLVI